MDVRDWRQMRGTQECLRASVLENPKGSLPRSYHPQDTQEHHGPLSAFHECTAFRSFFSGLDCDYLAIVHRGYSSTSRSLSDLATFFPKVLEGPKMRLV